MSAKTEQLEHRVEELERQLQNRPQRRSVRKRSKREIAGWPLYDIAIGPDWDAGERRGSAKGILAVGDIATGAVAVGGIAQGGIAIGGLACGLLSLGGCAFGLLGVIGGVAVGGFAYGGVAIGLKAIGGAAIGTNWFDAPDGG